MSIGQDVPAGDIDVALLLWRDDVLEVGEHPAPREGPSGPDRTEPVRSAGRARSRDLARYLWEIHQLGRLDRPRADEFTADEFAADEVGAALGWSRTMAAAWLQFAADVVVRLPVLHRALLDGRLDETKVRALAEWTRGMPLDLARRVVLELVGVAARETTSTLIDHIGSVAAALDPAWARRREEAARARARVVATLTPAGTADVYLRDIAPPDAVALMARLDSFASAIRAAGRACGLDPGIGVVRALVSLRQQDGTYAGYDDEALLDALIAELPAWLAATSGSADGGPDDGGPGGLDNGGPDDGGPDGLDDDGPDDDGPDDDRPDDDRPSDGGPDGWDDAASGGPNDDDPSAGGPPDSGALDDQDEHSNADEPDHSEAGEPEEPAHGDVEEPAHGDADEPVHGDAEAPVHGDAEEPEAPDHAGEPGNVGTGNAGTGGAHPVRDDADRRFEQIGGGVRTGTAELRLRLSTALRLDDLPGRIAAWGTITAQTGRDMLRRTRRAGGPVEWRLVLVDAEGHLEHVFLIRPDRSGRSSGPRRPQRGRIRGRMIVELAAPTAMVAGLDPDDHPDWAQLLRRAQVRLRDLTADRQPGGASHPAATLGDAHRRRAGHELDRWVRVRDRYCVGPLCTRAAHDNDLDHTRDWADDGLTVARNLGGVCRHCHRLKHEGGWRLEQREPGRFTWRSRGGATYAVAPRPVLDSLPARFPPLDGRPRPVLDIDPPPAPEHSGWLDARFRTVVSADIPAPPTRPASTRECREHGGEDDPPPF